MGPCLEFSSLLNLIYISVEALMCPQKDTSCIAPDGSNVITTTTTMDDSECASKYSTNCFLWVFFSINVLQIFRIDIILCRVVQPKFSLFFLAVLSSIFSR